VICFYKSQVIAGLRFSLFDITFGAENCMVVYSIEHHMDVATRPHAFYPLKVEGWLLRGSVPGPKCCNYSF
jgi:hypothetical protein